jgi:hypothetical protein
VGDVALCHEQALVGDGGVPAATGGSPVQGDELADNIALADLQPGRLAAVFLVLGRAAHGRELVHDVVGADPGRPLHHRVRADVRARPDRNTVADHRVGPDLDILRQDRLRRDHGRRMDRGRHRLCARVARLIPA